MPRFRWEKAWWWLLLGVGVGLGVGQLAAWVGGYVRPVVVFPLLVGSILGQMLVGGIRLLDLAHRPTVGVGLLLASLLCAGSEHWGYYRQAQRDYERRVADWQAKIQGLAALSSQFAQAIQQHLPPPPGSFTEYLQVQLDRGRRIGPWLLKGHWVWLSWLADAGFVLLAAAGLLWPTLGWPYCSVCESWYRSVRQGRLPPTDFAPWAELLALPVARPQPAPPFRVQFRLLQCQGQCTPGRLELVWEDAAGLHTWQTQLDDAQREKLEALWKAASTSQEELPSPPPPPPTNQEISSR